MSLQDELTEGYTLRCVSARRDRIIEKGGNENNDQVFASSKVDRLGEDYMDLPQARRLADMICSAVSKLEASSPEEQIASRNLCAKTEQRDTRGLRDGRYQHPPGYKSADTHAHEKITEERNAVLTIMAASAQLATLVRTPSQAVMELATGFNISAALRVVVEVHIPEVLRFFSELYQSLYSARKDFGCRHGLGLGLGTENHKESREYSYSEEEEGIPITWISILCNVDEDKLARIMRLLATHHVFVECFPGGRFRHNRLSSALDSGAPLQCILPNFEARVHMFEEIIGIRLILGNKYKVNDEKGKEETEEEKRWRAKYSMPTSGAALAALVGITCDESMMNATALTESLIESLPPAFKSPSHEKSLLIKSTTAFIRSQSDFSLTQEVQEDSSHPLRAAFSRARVHQGCATRTMFDWLNEKRNAKRLVRFGCAMKAMGEIGQGEEIKETVSEETGGTKDFEGGFDWASLPAGGLVVDVGGGVGTASLPLIHVKTKTKDGDLRGLRLVIQDVEAVIANAPQFWARSGGDPEKAVKVGRVTFEVQDFFEAQPRRYLEYHEEKPAAFLLRMICHNWPDAQCIKILRNLRNAASYVGEDKVKVKEDKHMNTSTKLVLIDNIILPACRSKENVMKAPEPLLANWGMANGLSYKLDTQMLSNHNAGERTLAQFVNLLARGGWKVIEVHSAGGGSKDPSCWMRQIIAEPASLPSDPAKGIDIVLYELGSKVDSSNERSPTLVESPRELLLEREMGSKGDKLGIGEKRGEKHKHREKGEGNPQKMEDKSQGNRDSGDTNRNATRSGVSLKKKASRVLRSIARVSGSRKH